MGKVVEALILKVKGRSVSVLTEREERLDLVWYPTRYQTALHAGSKISYTGRFDGMCRRVEQLDILHVPLLFARHDIVFLHALLEICIYFIPTGSIESSVYEFISSTIVIFEQSGKYEHKKILLCKLFALLGIYPYSSIFASFAELLLQEPVDKIMVGAVQLSQDNLCEQWILWSIHEHPFGKMFKVLPNLINKE